MSGCSGADSAQAVEQNYLYVLDLCATMAGAPSLPLHGSFKAVFYKLAVTYGIFSEGTKKKAIKDWAGYQGGLARGLGLHALSLASRSASSRSWQIRLIKKCIHDSLAAVAPSGSMETTMMMAQRQLDNSEGCDTMVASDSSASDGMPEVVRCQPNAPTAADQTLQVPADITPKGEPAKESGPELLDRNAAQRQAEKERKPLLPAPMHVDSELAEHARALVTNIQASDAQDPDLIAAQNKVLRAVNGVKRPACESEGGSEQPKRPRAKGKGKGKGKGKVGKENKGELNTGTEKVETATGASDKAEATADAPTDHDAEATADAPKDEEQAEPAKPKKVRGPRKETPKEILTSAWGEKEKALREAGIPIPDGYQPTTKSFTVSPDAAKEDAHSIQILWYTNQIYCNGFQSLLDDKVKSNGKGGVTISVLKHKGWTLSWSLATKVAGW